MRHAKNLDFSRQLRKRRAEDEILRKNYKLYKRLCSVEPSITHFKLSADPRSTMSMEWREPGSLSASLKQSNEKVIL